MRELGVITLTILLVNCASAKRGALDDLNDPHKAAEVRQQAEFDRGVKALDSEDYADAAQIFDKLLLSKPGTEMDLVAQFNSGAAYEGLGQCQKAIDRYRQVVRSSANKFKRIEGEALFRLSLAYECLGQDAKTVSALLDAQRRGKDVKFETANAEIPARLAAAYSRLGNRAKALEYFNQASLGLKSVVARGNGHVQSELIARTLFVMGRLNANQRKADVDPGTFLQSLSMQQPYLLQAMEMNRKPWSGRAEDDLKLAYKNIMEFKFSDAEKKRGFYTRGLQVINELKKIRMPKPDPAIDSLFATIEEDENRMQKELSGVAETNKLTPEAEKREGLRREGRLVDPTSESNSKKKKAKLRR